MRCGFVQKQIWRILGECARYVITSYSIHYTKLYEAEREVIVESERYQRGWEMLKAIDGQAGEASFFPDVGGCSIRTLAGWSVGLVRCALHHREQERLVTRWGKIAGQLEMGLLMIVSAAAGLRIA